MSDKPPAPAAKSDKDKDGEAKPKKKLPIMSIVGMLVPAILAAGAAYGASRVTMGKAAAQPSHSATPENSHKEKEKDGKYDPHPPGPTMALEPFLVTLPATDKKPHAMRLTIAIEFDSHTKEETIKAFLPRIRDAVLTYLRNTTYEEMSDKDRQEKIRAQMLDRIHAAGALGAEKILVTDMVLQ